MAYNETLVHSHIPQDLNGLTSDLSLIIISERKVTLLQAKIGTAKDTKERIVSAVLEIKPAGLP